MRLRLVVPAVSFVVLTAGTIPAAGTFEADAVRLEPPPRPLIVFVHGRGQLGVDSALLRREWKGDVDAALAQVGLPALRDDDVRLAWYADVLDAGTVAACGSGPASETSVGALTRGFLLGLASLVPDSLGAEAEATRSLLGDVLYFVDPGTRCAAVTRVRNAMIVAQSEGRPLIVVGYSLGSVVAYQYLATLRASPTPVHLVTIGSPLGMPIVREMLLGDFSAPRLPVSVASWVNLYHPDDAFAGPVGGDTGIHDIVLRTRASGDPHHASRYLRDQQTARVLADLLCATSGGSWAPKCATLARGAR